VTGGQSAAADNGRARIDQARPAIIANSATADSPSDKWMPMKLPPMPTVALARANAETWLGFAQDYRDETGTPHLTPDQMGDTMVFLNSDAASGINGVNLLVDAGHVMSSLVGSWAPGQPMIKAIMGRP
jgi:hypothetical protein